MKKCKIAAEEQGVRTHTENKVPVNKKARKSWRWFVNQIVKMIFCNKFLSFHVLVWPLHSTRANKSWIEDYKYWLHKIGYYVFNSIINTFGDYEEIHQ